MGLISLKTRLSCLTMGLISLKTRLVSLGERGADERKMMMESKAGHLCDNVMGQISVVPGTEVQGTRNSLALPRSDFNCSPAHRNAGAFPDFRELGTWGDASSCPRPGRTAGAADEGALGFGYYIRRRVDELRLRSLGHAFATHRRVTRRS